MYSQKACQVKHNRPTHPIVNIARKQQIKSAIHPLHVVRDDYKPGGCGVAEYVQAQMLQLL